MSCSRQKKSCAYAGGMIPFAKTRAERRANNDPRLSLEERYGAHDGYVAAVKRGAEKAMAAGFLLKSDADRLIAEAQNSNVLRSRPAGTAAMDGFDQLLARATSAIAPEHF